MDLVAGNAGGKSIIDDAQEEAWFVISLFGAHVLQYLCDHYVTVLWEPSKAVQGLV